MPLPVLVSPRLFFPGDSPPPPSLLVAQVCRLNVVVVEFQYSSMPGSSVVFFASLFGRAFPTLSSAPSLASPFLEMLSGSFRKTMSRPATEGPSQFFSLLSSRTPFFTNKIHVPVFP